MAISAVRLAATPPIIHSNTGAKMRDLFIRGKTHLRLGSAGLVLAALSACGGGGGSESVSPIASVSGKIADGYISGATVFWDCNGDLVPNSDEIKVKSGAQGAFTISTLPSAGCVLTAQVPLGAVDEDHPNQPISRAYTLISTKGNENFISPLSTLVALYMDANPGASLTDATSAISNLFGITGNINSDYIQENTLDALRRHGVAQIAVNSLQNNHTPGAPLSGLNSAYAEATTLAPSITALNFTTPASIINFISSVQGFLGQTNDTKFEKSTLDKYLARPNAKANLTESQLATLDWIINLPAISKTIRFGRIHWDEVSEADFATVYSVLGNSGLLANENNPNVLVLRQMRSTQLQNLNAYQTEHMHNANTFFGTDIARNFDFAATVFGSGVDAVGGAISLITGATVPVGGNYRLQPAWARSVMKTTQKPAIKDILLAVANAIKLPLDTAQDLKNALAKNDDEAFTDAEFKAVLEVINQILELQKAALKTGELGPLGQVFKPAFKAYGAIDTCSAPDPALGKFGAAAACLSPVLEVAETICEWIGPVASHAKGAFQWIRATSDALVAGEIYANATGIEVSNAQNVILVDWQKRINKVMLTYKLQEFVAGGYDRYFESYDPTIACVATEQRFYGTCISASPVVSALTPVTAAKVGTTTTFNITGTNLPATATLDITFDGCANIQFVSRSATQHQFTCTPNTAGTLTAVIRTSPGTTPLRSFPVVVSAASTATSCANPVTNTLFSEKFASPLNANVWSVDTGGGTVASTIGKLTVSGQGYRFPYIQTLDNPFPASGNYSFYCKANYLNFGPNGTGACIASQTVIPPGSANYAYEAGTLFQWWGDSGQRYITTASTSNSGHSLLFEASIDTGVGTHELETCVIGSTITTYKDGIQIGTATLPTGYMRPTRIWIGNPVNGSSFLPWTSFETHKIEVRQLQ